MNYSSTTVHQGIRSLWQYEMWKTERKITNHQLYKWENQKFRLNLNCNLCTQKDTMQNIESDCNFLYTSLFNKHVIGCQLTVVDSFLFFCPFIKHNNNSGEKTCSGFQC